MKKLIATILLTLIGITAYANETEQFGSCKFNFIGKNISTVFKLTMIQLSLDGANEPEEEIYKNLCNHFSGKTISIKPTKNDPEDPIDTVNNLRHIKVEVDRCSFDYYYGIKGNEFITDNNYKKVCSRKSNAQNSVTLFEQQDVKASRGGTQYYSVGCSDGVSGTVSETDVGKNYGSICAGGGHIGGLCKPKDSWSLSLAAQKVCIGK